MENNKSKSTTAIVAAVLLVIVGIGAVAYAFSQSSNDKKTTQTESKTSQSTEQTESTNEATDQTTSAVPTIVFTDDGFTQDTYRFPAGTAINVDNQSSMDMQFSSADHPTHRENPELNMAVLGAGESGTFTPPGKGTYGFHDHINDQFEGTLIIE